MPPLPSSSSSRQTLQLRHQLTCADVTLQSAAYDTTRHHVLTYDSRVLAPHALRLFSLRRELKTTQLFDDFNPPPPLLPSHATKPSSSINNSKNNSTTAANNDIKELPVPVVLSISLEYSAINDVFICVYSAQNVPAARARSKRTASLEDSAVFNVLFLEPATLKKLVHYPGPPSHRLQSVYFDANSDRLVLAVHRRQSGSASRSTSDNNAGAYTSSTSNNQQSKSARSQLLHEDEEVHDGEDEGMSKSNLRLGPMLDHIDILRISKREIGVAKQVGDRYEEPMEQRRVMLCVEKARSSLFHAETIDLVCGADGLTRLFGVGRATPGWGANAENFLVEWCENSEQQLELIRRVVFRDAVTAFAISPCSKWLFSGHASGALRAWNISRTSIEAKKWAQNYALGSSPLETESAAWHTTPIATIRVFCSSDRPGSKNDSYAETDVCASTETMVVTADRDHGVVKHWRFQVEGGRIPFTGDDDLAARMDLVGVYNVCSDVSARQSGHTSKGKNKKALVESVLTTIPICVNIDMGGFVERLLLVLHADAIHVLKVQTVMHVLQTTCRGDEISAVRVVNRQLVMLSGDRVNCLHTLNTDSTNTAQSNVVAPPASHKSSTISAMECFATSHGRSFVTLGWSAGGVVEVRSLNTNVRVLMLQDPRLNAWISAISVVLQPVASQASSERAISTALPSETDPTCTRSWGGLLRSTAVMSKGFPDYLDLNAARDDINAASVLRTHSRTVFIFAGTECGHIFGWRSPIDFDAEASNRSERLVLEAKYHVNNAHSAHVVQIATFPSNTGYTDRIVSLGADGMVKVWEMASLTMLGHVNTATEGHMSMPSCMGIVGGIHGQHRVYLVVGFEDGMLALWSIDQSKISFTEMRVLSHHERRVTRISTLDRVNERGLEFVTCSLDMTAIIWVIKEDSMEERRYFDIGAPVVDICTLGNHAIAALANEVCAFEYCVREASDIVSEMPRFPIFDSERISKHLSATESEDPKIEELTAAIDALILDNTDDLENVALEIDAPTSEPSSPVISTSAVTEVSKLTVTPDSARTGDVFTFEGVEDAKIEEPGTTCTTSLHLGIETIAATDNASSHLLAQGTEDDTPIEESMSARRKSLQIDIETLPVDIIKPESLEAGCVKVEKMGVIAPVHKKKRRKPSAAESIGLKASEEFPDASLVSRLRLSRSFQQHWSGGYCWCSSSSELRVVWKEVSPEEPYSTCDDCHKRIHTLTLKKAGYKPHFSFRAILGIIVDVYESVVAPSHSLLFKSASKSSSRESGGTSLHSALFRVLTAKFGMQAVVEEKVKLFFVSAIHYVREADAVAVFGELLSMFTDYHTISDTPVPDEMAALCVCCYSWFFSRAMVTNGDRIIGSGHETRKQTLDSHQDSIAEIEKGKSTCWQFVNLQNARLCAQEMLMYPLVSPGYLRNVLMYTGEYAQEFPTRPTAARELTQSAIDSSHGKAQWIEIHRFLRLLVGEWKQQNSEFRLAEQVLFVQPLSDNVSSTSEAAERRADVIEKLRLLLSCFIFYDHDREGVMTVHDFTVILRKLRYLWPNENVTAEEAENDTSTQLSLTFENTILAAKRRFADRDGDGQICYLDFWAMLYIVGVRTLSLLKFREIPSFCKGYKLEISPDLHGLLQCYMERSSTMMLPRGFQIGKSSFDQRAAVQHQRRVRGLHDGLFTMPTGLGTSLSSQELISMGDANCRQVDPKDQIYLEGTAAAFGESSSVTAMDRFRPLTRESEDNKGRAMYGASPVVFGVRRTGPREKRRALLSVSAMTSDALPARQDSRHSSQTGTATPLSQDTRTFQAIDSGSFTNATDSAKSTFSSTYIQFPFVRPRQKRVEMPTKDGPHEATNQHVIERMQHMAVDQGVHDWQAKILQEHEDDEIARQQSVIPTDLSARREHADHQLPHRQDSFNGTKEVPRTLAQCESLKRQQSKKTAQTAGPVAVDDIPTKVSVPSTKAGEPRPAVKKGKLKTTVVVIPNVDKESARVPATPTAVVETVTTTPALHPSHNGLLSQVQLTPKSPVVEVENADVTSEKLNSIEDDSAFYQPERWSPRPQDASDDLLLVMPSETVPAPTFAEEATADASAVEEYEVTHVLSPDSGQEFTSALGDDEELYQSANSEKLTPPTHTQETDSDLSARSDGSDENGNSDNDDDDDDASQEDVDEGESDEQDSADPTIAFDKTDLDNETDLATNENPINILTTPNADGDTDTAIGSAKESTAVLPSTSTSSPSQPVVYPEVAAISSPRPHESKLTIHSVKTDIFDPKQQPRQHERRVDSINLTSPVSQQSQDVAIVQPTAATEKHSSTRITTVTEQQLKGGKYHHSFRFSQQPAFRCTATVFNNPLRSGQWNPSDDSDSDEEKLAGSQSQTQQDDAASENEFECIEDVELQLTPEALQAYRATFGPRLRRRKADEGILPSLRHFGLAVSAASQLSRVSPRRDLSNEPNHDAMRRNSKLAAELWPGGDSSSALYDGHLPPHELSGDITFSSEAEEQMRQKWLAFFNHAEAAMFSPLKQELHDREEAQRIHEEKQSRLMKKRQEQQAQDTLRLQQSRRENATLKTSTHEVADKVESSSASVTDQANFRLRRMARESCQELQNELRFGESVARVVGNAGEVQYFFFEYDPRVHGSILTLRLDTECGEAEIFMSTETKAPCVSDYMWRSIDKSKGLDEGNGQKLVLYSHDLAKARASARTDRYEDGQDESPVILFYVSVVSLESNTKFAVAVMASGQKTEPSHAVKMVDTLIQQFNVLSKSLQRHMPASFEPSTVPSHFVATHPSYPYRHSRRGNEKATETEIADEIYESGAMGNRTGGILGQTLSRCRESPLDTHDDDDEPNPEMMKPWREGSLKRGIGGSDKGSAENSDDGSEEETSDAFHQLLESIGEKRGFGARKSKACFLSGPTSDQFEFIRDEVTNFEDAVARYSPERTRPGDDLMVAGNDSAPLDSSTLDAISIVMPGDRLVGRSFASHTHVAARRGFAKSTKHRLSPLKGSSSEPAPLPSKASHTSSSAATALRMAKFAPRPVAYSLSSLDHNSSHLRLSKSSSISQLPSRHIVLPNVHSIPSLK